jgi:hypothetical protein
MLTQAGGGLGALGSSAHCDLAAGSNHGESMRGGNGLADGQLTDTCARARAARRQSQLLVEQFRAAKYNTALIMQLLRNARDQAEEIHALWLSLHPESDRLNYSAHARLQARLKSMPVIEQAKGIIMAQCGWPEDRAFEALRRASQRENMKLRDLAAKVVAQTVRSAPDQARLDQVSPDSPLTDELAHARPRRLPRATGAPAGRAGMGLTGPPTRSLVRLCADRSVRADLPEGGLTGVGS